LVLPVSNLLTQFSNLGIDVLPVNGTIYPSRINAYILHLKFAKINIFCKPIYKQKGKGFKMEETAQERLMQFIHSLTDEECKMIVSFIENEKYTIGDSD
jgi:hypothetical protein